MPLQPKRGWSGAIADDTSGYFFNYSGIPHSVKKLTDLPAGWDIIDYGEEYSPETTTTNIVWQGPWTNRFAFLNWVLGYTLSTGVLNSVDKPMLTRTIPAQHPEMPWLYAQHADLIEKKGALIRSQRSYALTYDNEYIEQIPPGPPTPPIPGVQPLPGPPPPVTIPNPQDNYLLPMVAWFDNRATDSFDGKAVYRVRYDQLDYEVREDDSPGVQAQGEICRYVSRDRTWAIQSLDLSTLAGGQLQFTAGPFIGQPIPAGGVLLIPTMQLVYTWHQVPDVPDVTGPIAAGISACLGKVNQATFDGVDSDYVDGAPGYPAYAFSTLLCQPPTIRRTRNPVGRVTWEIKYHLDYRPNGWNFFPASNGNYYPAVFVNSGNSVYQSADFNQLFVPPPPVTYQ